MDVDDYKIYTEWINDFEVGLGVTFNKLLVNEAGRLREALIKGGQKFDEIKMDILAREFKSPFLNDILDKRMNR